MISTISSSADYIIFQLRRVGVRRMMRTLFIDKMICQAILISPRHGGDQSLRGQRSLPENSGRMKGRTKLQNFIAWLAGIYKT